MAPQTGIPGSGKNFFLQSAVQQLLRDNFFIPVVHTDIFGRSLGHLHRGRIPVRIIIKRKALPLSSLHAHLGWNSVVVSSRRPDLLLQFGPATALLGWKKSAALSMICIALFHIQYN